MALLAIYKKGRTPPYLNPHISQVRVLVVQRKMRGLQIGVFALRPARSVLVVGPLLEIGKTSLLMSSSLMAGAWTERKKMYHGGSFLKLADDNMDIQNPEAQNRELSGF